MEKCSPKMVRAKKGAVIRHLNAPFCLSVNKAI
jgi:hypothetical protein